jgi:hypothetical protein
MENGQCSMTNDLCVEPDGTYWRLSKGFGAPGGMAPIQPDFAILG